MPLFDMRVMQKSVEFQSGGEKRGPVTSLHEVHAMPLTAPDLHAATNLRLVCNACSHCRGTYEITAHPYGL
ncbi:MULTISPECIES: hypothetical protein [unclassified Roseovarius]|uniref:hypothetical protein n=1 Tax=unclassified Roseovarius TaxID=2614913 RepID=UPI0018DB366A|nr:MULTISPECIES: hypothetical protein [unclassified Roseovarius]